MRFESEIEQAHCKDAKAAGWRVYKIMRASPNGFPDRLYFRARRLVIIEWKRPGGVLSAQQKLRHKELRTEGFEVHVVDNIQDANRILQLDDGGRTLDDPDSLDL